MNKKILVGIVGVVTMAMLTVILIKERSNKMKLKLTREGEITVDEGIKDYVEKSESVKVVPRDENGLSEADKRELKERFEGMSPAEIDIFMSLVPVELCIKRIEKELDKAKECQKAISAMLEFYTK